MRSNKKLDLLNEKLKKICGKYFYFGEYAAEEGPYVDADFLVECLRIDKDEVRQLLLKDGWDIVLETNFNGEEFDGRAFCIKDKTKTYRIVYTETSVGIYYVDANSEEEAKKKFERASMNGEIDFTDMCINDTDVKIKEMKS